MTILAIIGTVIFLIFLSFALFESAENSLILTIRAQFLFFLNYGAFVYLITRSAYLFRLKKYQKPTYEMLEAYSSKSEESVTYLVPSYKEEPSIIRKTLLSAALQYWPKRRVVLLVDDPPSPTNNEDKLALRLAQNLPKEIENLLQAPCASLQKAHEEFITRVKKERVNIKEERKNLIGSYQMAAIWFEEQGKKEPNRDHTDHLFLELTFTQRANELYNLAINVEKEKWQLDQITQGFCSLASLFAVELSYFERKRYLNLSHASNKAMNINSYVGLMGKSYSEKKVSNGIILEKDLGGSFQFSDSDFVAMLDADTILTYDYTSRLLYKLGQKGSQKIAVIQTPYSAFPNAPGVLERTAGATTNLQFITHQGFTQFGATFWVGANAIARKSALEEIEEETEERGYKIQKFIQDRTVIEDTESSIDLVAKGWTLFNYPDRLSYSSTPDDFGALLIQRRRWANGGLLIVPKLLRCLFQKPLSFRKLGEFFFRFNYLFSITAILFGMILSTGFSAPKSEVLFWAVMTMVPYLLIYTRDLCLIGYSFSDLFRVMALNTLLIPVNLAGVLKSCQQAITGKHIPFCRTPKTDGRTSVPGLYIILVYALLAYVLLLIVNHPYGERLATLGTHMMIAAPLLYAVLCFIGLTNGLLDVIQTVRYRSRLIFGIR